MFYFFIDNFQWSDKILQNKFSFELSLFWLHKKEVSSVFLFAVKDELCMYIYK